MLAVILVSDFQLKIEFKESELAIVFILKMLKWSFSGQCITTSQNSQSISGPVSIRPHAVGRDSTLPHAGLYLSTSSLAFSPLEIIWDRASA